MGLPPAKTQAGITMPSWVTAANTYYGYCTIADVQLLFQDQANMPSSANNSSVVAQCITEASLELHKSLELAYVMPYVGADLTISGTLNELNAKLAAANIYDRIYGANEPDMSTVGALLRSYVETRVLGILDGEENWAPPIGDAVPNGDKPQYPHASIAQGVPSGASPLAPMEPIFTLRGLNYRKPSI